jgi:dGTPase
MEWSRLLNVERFGHQGSDLQPGRTEFQRDFDRLIFSTSFRRMQGKTQVFPLPESDSTHTRLTHSLEVSCVARSLGSMAARRVELEDVDPEAVSALVAAAALAHDCGNPPFGHSGEDAIAEFFRGPRGSALIAGLNAAERTDLTSFEGNALGFRLLTRTRPRQSDWPGGMQLTLAVLGAFTKYPKASIPRGNAGRISQKKFGFFQSEAQTFATIAEKLGLNTNDVEGWCRHLLAFLTEAADDICYTIMDLEDGVRLGLVDQERAEAVLAAIGDVRIPPTNGDTLGGIKEPHERIGYLRAKAINRLVNQAVDVFVRNVDAILTGSFDKPLLDLVDSFQILEQIREVTAACIYPHKPVVEIETAGFRVLGGLLEDFLDAVLENPSSKRAKKVRALISKAYLPHDDDSRYEKIMAITEFVAGMTDDYAIATYRVLRGMELPRT